MISLFIMTSKGYHILQALVGRFGSGFIDRVVAARDKQIEDDHFEQIRDLCAAQHIEFHDRLSAPPVKSRYSFAISWRWLIDCGDGKELVVFHDSLLPEYRGFAPLVNSLINGESRIGVTALLGHKEYDKGNILHQAATDISYPLRIAEAIELVNHNYEEACLAVAEMIHAGQTLSGRPQNEAEATYSLWRDEEDYAIDWTKSAAAIRRFIDATGTPYKGASALCDGVRIRIRRAEEFPDVTIVNRDAGKVIFMEEGLPVVVCGNGLLKIYEAITEDGSSALPLKKFRTRFS